ncbi:MULTISPECIES: DUF2986 domain-containing protein [Shewanella]|uniref:DUF2986 domain-containing protein n=1 Tax=Shewanella bicestrii TaxID=2018305 RepID=A0A220UNY1_9GAMM|nr:MULTISPECIES: DUF2986 domain-containing protein [Shewanella]ASK69572.1 hypothetical protein CF168_12235 [Shewanella bicestrii]MDH1470070.1 DUF2986 domain-containing protein [Shewanella sp. GD03713]QXN23439.1 DUF2986 domain-containing protein [Shewanella putrefaciens]
MNKKQKIVKKMAKREKAKQNKIEKPKVGAKPRYISKAERARLEAETPEAVALEVAQEIAGADASSAEDKAAS